METVARPVIIYIVLLIVFRITGKRTLNQITTFDFVLLLIIGEATQQAILGDDFSVTNAVIVIISFIAMDILLNQIKKISKSFDRWSEGSPVIILENGKPITQRMKDEGVNKEDILQSARENQGLERLDQIKYAILEKSGGISIIPKER